MNNKEKFIKMYNTLMEVDDIFSECNEGITAEQSYNEAKKNDVVKEMLVLLEMQYKDIFAEEVAVKTNLYYKRINKDLTAKELSNLSGVNMQMIQKYELGYKDINKAQAMTLYKLAKALDCTIEDLLEV